MDKKKILKDTARTIVGVPILLIATLGGSVMLSSALSAITRPITYHAKTNNSDFMRRSLKDAHITENYKADSFDKYKMGCFLNEDCSESIEMRYEYEISEMREKIDKILNISAENGITTKDITTNYSESIAPNKFGNETCGSLEALAYQANGNYESSKLGLQFAERDEDEFSINWYNKKVNERLALKNGFLEDMTSMGCEAQLADFKATTDIGTFRQIMYKTDFK